MKKRGLTLLELVISMAIFIVIITLAIGGFVTVSRMKALSSTVKETQQKTRIAQEMITRLARQAEKVVITPDEKTIDLYFNIRSENPLGARFKIDGTKLLYSDCSGLIDCKNEATYQSLYEGIELQSGSSFKKVGTMPPTLQVELFGKIEKMNNTYYSDEINLSLKIILERLI